MPRMPRLTRIYTRTGDAGRTRLGDMSETSKTDLRLEAYACVEAPKGELGFHLVSSGGNKPYRLRIRPPSFINLQALPEMAQGHLVSDLVAVIGTIDIVLGEVDR